ncbi:MAG: hypothetical protein K2Q22_08070 [Cytophagales bacterium]|nr:hypothetical protein [Cytophagales bacterium]
MKKYFYLISLMVFISFCQGCRKSKQNENDIVKSKNISDFLPKNYKIFDKISGDLNKDGKKDIVIIIKGTNKANIVKDESRGELDRNRRGIIILFNKNGLYELASSNYDCFSSENEDGGVYFAPELFIDIRKGNLYVDYSHGRYGYWKYTFKFKESDFELIGYDASSGNGPVVEREISINFLTKKKLEKINTNENAEMNGEEVFKETWSKVSSSKPILLSQIKDFDEIDTSVW